MARHPLRIEKQVKRWLVENDTQLIRNRCSYRDVAACLRRLKGRPFTPQYISNLCRCTPRSRLRFRGRRAWMREQLHLFKGTT